MNTLQQRELLADTIDRYNETIDCLEAQVEEQKEILREISDHYELQAEQADEELARLLDSIDLLEDQMHLYENRYNKLCQL